jgi:hypothetical protein
MMLNPRRTRAAFQRVLLASLAVSAVFAVGAAAAQAEGPFWYTGSTPESLTKLTGTKTVLASAGETSFKAGQKAGQTTTGLALTPVEGSGGGGFPYSVGIFAKSVEFKETVALNETGGSGRIRGRLVLNGITVNYPACQEGIYPNYGNNLKSNPVEQIPVVINGKHYVEIISTSGRQNALFTIPITGCVAAGNWPVKGAIVAEDSSYFETSLSHTLTFSKAIQQESGQALTYAGGAAFAEGSLIENLAEPLYWTLK